MRNALNAKLVNFAGLLNAHILKQFDSVINLYVVARVCLQLIANVLLFVNSVQI